MLKINKNLFPYVLRYKNSSKSVGNLCRENKKIFGCYKRLQRGTCNVDQIGNLKKKSLVEISLILLENISKFFISHFEKQTLVQGVNLLT
jgi:hypothetical protein